jgi:hypothetical protein
MALTPTEREEHFFKAMVDAADGSTPEELEPTERREHWYKEIIDAIKAGGGGSGGALVVTDTDGTLDKTWQEIYDADFAVVVQSSAAGKKKYAVTEVLHNRDNTEFLVNLIEGDPASYTASSADGYPMA